MRRSFCLKKSAVSGKTKCNCCAQSSFKEGMVDSVVFGSGEVLGLESLGLTTLGVTSSIDGMFGGVSLCIFPTTKSIGVPAVQAVNENGPTTKVLNNTVRNVDTIPPRHTLYIGQEIQT